jgi:hypothetical protein
MGDLMDDLFVDWLSDLMDGLMYNLLSAGTVSKGCRPISVLSWDCPVQRK